MRNLIININAIFQLRFYVTYLLLLLSAVFVSAQRGSSSVIIYDKTKPVKGEANVVSEYPQKPNY